MSIKSGFGDSILKIVFKTAIEGNRISPEAEENAAGRRFPVRGYPRPLLGGRHWIPDPPAPRIGAGRLDARQLAPRPGRLGGPLSRPGDRSHRLRPLRPKGGAPLF